MRIGIDLGGTKIEGIRLDESGQADKKIRIGTPATNYDDVIKATCSLINDLQTKKRLTVGIGTPGTLDSKKNIMKNSDSLCLNGKPFKKDIENELGYSVEVENDANCFTLSEANYGTGEGFECVFGVVLGTGCGGGLVQRKALINGPNRIAGEWGHNCMPVSVRKLIESDRLCHCGRINCIETVLSGRGLKQTFRELSAIEMEPEEISEQARLNNSEAIDCIDIYARQLSGCLSTIINVIDPDVIVLGGGLSNIKSLYQLIPKYLRGQVYNDAVLTKVVPASFGDASGARGAACLWPKS